jgi:hypothetical protein
MSRHRFWPALNLLLAAGVAASQGIYEDLDIRAALVLPFLLVCPGMALVRLLRIDDGVAELMLAVALSFALNAIVPGTMLYAGAWSPQVGLLVLIAITLGATLVDLARQRLERLEAGRTP